MTIGGQSIAEIAINWFPMFVLIGVWIVFLVRMRGGYSKYQIECMELTRRQVESLERIAAILEKRT